MAAATANRIELDGDARTSDRAGTAAAAARAACAAKRIRTFYTNTNSRDTLRSGLLLGHQLLHHGHLLVGHPVLGREIRHAAHAELFLFSFGADSGADALFGQGERGALRGPIQLVGVPVEHDHEFAVRGGLGPVWGEGEGKGGGKGEGRRVEAASENCKIKVQDSCPVSLKTAKQGVQDTG